MRKEQQSVPPTHNGDVTKETTGGLDTRRPSQDRKAGFTDTENDKSDGHGYAGSKRAMLLLVHVTKTNKGTACTECVMCATRDRDGEGNVGARVYWSSSVLL